MKFGIIGALTAEHAQDTFEYLLVIGTAAVAMVAALMALDTLIPRVLGHVCESVDTANAVAAVGSCLGIS